jgi:hypothetical protein
MVLDVPVIAERPAEPVNTPLVSQYISTLVRTPTKSVMWSWFMVDVLNVAIMGAL